MTLRIVPPDTEELWKRVVAANEAFMAAPSKEGGEAVVKAFDRFADAFCKIPVVAADIKANVRTRVRFVLECAA
jgi:hypothetical protein